MELIPILSTIILVATISTFILAVGAYVLYKIRESRSSTFVAGKQTQSAELVEPAETVTYVKKPESEIRERTFTNHTSSNKNESRKIVSELNEMVKVEVPVNKYTKYSQEGFVPAISEDKEQVLKWR